MLEIHLRQSQQLKERGYQAAAVGCSCRSSDFHLNIKRCSVEKLNTAFIELWLRLCRSCASD